MTPQLQQAIKLLQLSRMELMDVVREELEENPVLEEGQDTPDEKTPGEEEQSAALLRVVCHWTTISSFEKGCDQSCIGSIWSQRL